MKIRIESSQTDEIVIRYTENAEHAALLKATIETALFGEAKLPLTDSGAEYFIPQNDILFFDSCNGKVYAHTASHVYVAHYKLFELEELLSCRFVRISKSTIANIDQVIAIRRELVGNGELLFRNCDKKAYFSRSYYKLLEYKINEMRLKK